MRAVRYARLVWEFSWNNRDPAWTGGCIGIKCMTGSGRPWPCSLRRSIKLKRQASRIPARSQLSPLCLMLSFVLSTVPSVVSSAVVPDLEQHLVYNQVDPAVRNSYKRPAFIDEKTWKKAEEDNPDPSKLTPAAVIGWENLRERLVEQQKEMAKMAEFVTLMQTTTSNGLRSVTLIRTRMEASRRRHLAQAHRFLKIQRKLDAVRCMNKPLHDAERQLRVALDNVHRSLGPPQQALKDLNSLLLQGERQTEDVEEINDPEKLRRIFQALEGQRDGLEHLMRIVKKDKQDLEIMMKSRMMTQ